MVIFFNLKKTYNTGKTFILSLVQGSHVVRTTVTLFNSLESVGSTIGSFVGSPVQPSGHAHLWVSVNV